MFLDLDAVAARYAIHRNSIRNWMAQGRFPLPIRLGDRIARWPLEKLQEWEAKSYPVKEPENVSNPEGRRCIR